MSSEPSTIKCTILAGTAAAVLTLAVNVGYGLVCLSWQGVPPPDVPGEVQAGTPYLILGIFLATVGAILGTRLAARRPEGIPRWAGLAVGTGLATVVVAVSWLQGHLDFWLPPNALMAVVGGWLGAWLYTREIQT